jgi:hypothetical protein
MLSKLNLSKDLQKYCTSFLTKDEIIYSNGEWGKFQKNKIYMIAVKNGWLEILKWVVLSGLWPKTKWL